MTEQPQTPEQAPLDDVVRPHVFDGIQEYDKRMPNWWLWTLYGAIAFSIGYWVFYHEFGMLPDPGVALQWEMKENTQLAARNSGVLTDDLLWQMSHDSQVVAAGKATFLTTCASCHQPDMSGGIGPNLKDEVWIHGGNPTQIVDTITKGVMEKGMPTWGPVLGKTKITEVAAFILSVHPAPPKVTQTSAPAAK